MKTSVSILIAFLILATGSITLLGQAAATGDKLAAGPYVLYAVSPQTWRFTVDPKTMANATLVGKFTVTAGTPPSIDAFVFNEAEFKKWRAEDEASKSAKPLYSALKQTTGDINVRLTEPGIYYVVFSNLYQYEGKKMLNLDVRLQYSKP